MSETTVVSGVGLTIGLDIGDRMSEVCVLDSAGTVLERGRVATNAEAMRYRFGGARVLVALETGTHSAWISELLEGLGHEVIVANPRKVRSISVSDSKTDRFDAEQLARLLRVDRRLLSPVAHRDRATRADLALVRSRGALVRARTLLVNHVRGSLKSFGVRVRACSTAVFPRRAAWKIPRELRVALIPLLREIAELTTRIIAMERRIEQVGASRYPETQKLRLVDGVGAVTSLTFVLTLEDPQRFASSRAVGAYLGLRPRHRQSGARNPELHITKAGDRDLRRLLVQSAQYMLGPFGKDSDLRRAGLALAARGGKSAKKRAIIAVARKLSVLLHRLWTSAEPYDPLRHAEGRNLPRRKRA
jgi:transposase